MSEEVRKLTFAEFREKELGSQMEFSKNGGEYISGGAKAMHMMLR